MHICQVSGLHKNNFNFAHFIGQWTWMFNKNSFKLMWGSSNAHFVGNCWYIEPLYRIWSHNILTDFIIFGSHTKHVNLWCTPLPFLPLTLAHRGLDVGRGTSAVTYSGQGGRSYDGRKTSLPDDLSYPPNPT